MITVSILEDNDLVQACDWCRPLVLNWDGDYISTTSIYSGGPMNNMKWVRVREVFGECWFGKPVIQLNKYIKHEFMRGDILIDHQLKSL